MGCFLMGDPRMGSPFLRSAKCCWEGSRKSGAVMTGNFGPPQQTALFHSKDQEGRAGRPVDGRAVGNPIKGFPVHSRTKG